MFRDKLKHVHKFENLDYSDLVICVKYEGSAINHTGGKSNYSEKEKWLPFTK